MARRPTSRTEPAEDSDRQKIADAFMVLLAERGYEDIGLGDVAARAGVPLHRCRSEFDSLVGVLAAVLEDIDRKVLAGGDADMAEELPRERLFDVLMRRLEALAPHKQAIRSLARSARCNPPLAFALNGLAVRSQRWMLAAADIDSAGLRGAVRAQGLACLFSDVVRVWLDDDDPGLARTMAVLDRQLARGARWARGFDDLCRLLPNPCRVVSRNRTRAPRADDLGEQPAVV
jgi:AcrR family transcriptional regulator